MTSATTSLFRFSGLLFLLVLFGFTAEASAVGKIVGRVTDARTGEPLFGVNVFIEGTQIGNTTNVDGEYVILNLRPGAYTLVFRYVGYATQRVENVRVNNDQTTEINVQLREEVIEGEEIVVQAERPLIQKDQTASKKTVIAEEIEILPVESFFGVLQTQAGVTQGASGELHIRGGRSNEIAYLVDGMSVGNPFDTNGLATEVATNAIEELSVVSGAFNAEYGQAMSGIVNISIKEGGERLQGSLSAYAGDYVTSHDDIFFTPSKIDGDTRTLTGSLGGPIPGTNRNLRFFLSGRYDESNGHIYGVREHLPGDSANFNTGYYEIHGRPWWEYADGTLEVPNERVPMTPRHSYNVTGKLTWRLFSGIKADYTLLLDGGQRKPFDFNYRYNPDGVVTYRDNSMNHAFGWTHTINPTTFYTLRVSYATNEFSSYLYEDPMDPRYTPDQGAAGSGNILGFPGTNFLFGGSQKGHVYEDSQSFRGKLDLTKQIGTTHEFKVGLDWRLHRLTRENFTILYDFNNYRTPTVEDVGSPTHDRFEDQPVTELSAYVQDKLEFEDFIVNVGLRYDRFDPHGEYIPNLVEPVLRDGRDISVIRAEAEPKNMFSPRLGVAFPITSRGVIHFSYGHFYQMPTLRQMYTNPEWEFAKGTVPSFGNANLRPEFTVAYEIGLQQQIAEDIAFDITGYYKDIRDYLTQQLIRFSTIAGEDQFAVQVNQDYANVRGIVFSLTKRRPRNGLLSANIDYTFQLAEGGDNDPNAFFFNFLSGRENEFIIVPLDFDQQHVLNATVSLNKPGNWGASLIGSFVTGYPYTPQIFDQNLDRRLLRNQGRKPNQIDLDLNLFKTFKLSGGVQVTAFARAFNLLDRLNERFVFDDTGRATYSTIGERGVHLSWEPLYGQPGIHTLEEYNTRPQYYSAPRQIRLGITVEFGR